MSDQVTITTIIIAAIPTTIASVVGAIIALRSSRVTKSTHELVNGSMLAQLRLHAKTARALALIHPNTETIATAESAEKILKEHLNKLKTN